MEDLRSPDFGQSFRKEGAQGDRDQPSRAQDKNQTCDSAYFSFCESDKSFSEERKGGRGQKSYGNETFESENVQKNLSGSFPDPDRETSFMGSFWDNHASFSGAPVPPSGGPGPTSQEYFDASNPNDSGYAGSNHWLDDSICSQDFFAVFDQNDENCSKRTLDPVAEEEEPESELFGPRTSSPIFFSEPKVDSSIFKPKTETEIKLEMKNPYARKNPGPSPKPDVHFGGFSANIGPSVYPDTRQIPEPDVDVDPEVCVEHEVEQEVELDTDSEEIQLEEEQEDFSIPALLKSYLLDRAEKKTMRSVNSAVESSDNDSLESVSEVSNDCLEPEEPSPRTPVNLSDFYSENTEVLFIPCNIDCCCCDPHPPIAVSQEDVVMSVKLDRPGLYFVENGGIVPVRNKSFHKDLISENASRILRGKLWKWNAVENVHEVKTGVFVNVDEDDFLKIMLVVFPKKYQKNHSPSFHWIGPIMDSETGARPKEKHTSQPPSKKRKETFSSEAAAGQGGGDQGGGDQGGSSPGPGQDSSETQGGPNNCHCDICFNESEQSDDPLRTLTNDEIAVARFSVDYPVKFLCAKHYKNIFNSFRGANKKCGNPFQIPNHAVKTGLRVLSLEVLANAKRFTGIEMCRRPFQNVCRDCEARIIKEIMEAEAAYSEQSSEEMSCSQPSYGSLSQGSNFSTTSEGQGYRDEQQLQDLNKTFAHLNISPVKPNQSKSKIGDKFERFKVGFKEKFGLNTESDQEDSERCKNTERDRRIVGKSYEEKLKYLTLLPREWAYSKFQEEFHVTKHTVRTVKDMQRRDVEMRERKKRSDSTNPATIEKVEEFFRRPHISRQLPDEKHAVTVRTADGGTQLRPKSLLYQNLTETYNMFKEEYPDVKIGLSKFAECKPEEVVYDCDKASMKICLCTHCHNPDRMIQSSVLCTPDFRTLVPDCPPNGPILPRMFVERLLCPEASRTRDCHMRSCEKCRDQTDLLRQEIEENCENLGIDAVKWESWESTDRTNVVEHVSRYQDFAEIFTQTSPYRAWLRLLYGLPFKCSLLSSWLLS